MAEGITNYFWGNKLEAYSAGTQASSVHPMAIDVMKEMGIDISKHRSKIISEYDGQHFDYVITLCGSADEICPLYIGGAKKTHIGFDDPAQTIGAKEDILREFRRVRDEIKLNLNNFFQSQN